MGAWDVQHLYILYIMYTSAKMTKKENAAIPITILRSRCSLINEKHIWMACSLVGNVFVASRYVLSMYSTSICFVFRIESELTIKPLSLKFSSTYFKHCKYNIYRCFTEKYCQSLPGCNDKCIDIMFRTICDLLLFLQHITLPKISSVQNCSKVSLKQKHQSARNVIRIDGSYGHIFCASII